jgi:hypothetical protein
MLGTSGGELAFVVVLVIVIVLAQVAPKIGEAIAARLDPGEGDRRERDEQGRV